MREAASTWALVVGIDAYDAFTPLQGAARDAAAAVRWLRRLGVPDEQVLLHAAPCDAARGDLEALGRPWLGCTEPELWASFDRLWQEQGSRLFVFLSGHGFYEPSGARVFLTREATQRVLKNLGIDWYARLLRGFAFDRQFLVVDGCLNLPYTASERARFAPGEQSGVVLPPPRPGVQQYLCTAASPGQRALEDSGRGLFTSTLLTTLDLDALCADCTDIDEATGAYRLDLRTAVDSVRSKVAGRAAELGRAQDPVLQPLHDGHSPPVVPVAEVVPTATSEVLLRVRPEEALPAVSRVEVFSDAGTWRRRWPVPPAERGLRLPVGVPVAVRCVVQPEAGWAQPAQQEFLTQERDQVVVLDLEPPPPDDDVTVTVETVGPTGERTPGMTRDAYARVDEVLADVALDVHLVHHESGPVLRAGPDDRAALSQVALRVGTTVDRTTDPDVHAVLRGLDTRVLRTSVRVVARDPLRLAGLLQDLPAVHVEDHQVTVGQCADGLELEVSPGPVHVRVALPWGTWTTTVACRTGEQAVVLLPRTVGRPTLRTQLLRDASVGNGPPRSLVLPEDAPVPRTGRRSGYASAWSGSLVQIEPFAHSSPGEDVTTVGPLSLPLSPAGPVGLTLGEAPRAEPLSVDPSPLWDHLVAGRPGPVDPRAPGDPLTAVMAAYACLEAGALDAVDVLLERLSRAAPFLPDVVVIRAAAGYADGLDQLALVPATPLFSRGVTLSVLTARDHGLDAAAEYFHGLERQLAPESVWTLWTA